jgi:cytidine deaminase
VIAESVLQRLIESAKAASRHAYCPYSQFRVGAAVLGGSGKLYAGCNIENASYGMTICAERSALARAVTDGETKIDAVVVYTPTAMPTAPCGACRQALNEFGPEMECICVCDGNNVAHATLKELLPAAFGPKNLA